MQSIKFFLWLAAITFLQYAAAQSDRSGITTVVACQNTVGRAVCPPGTVVDVVRGFYGRRINDETCQELDVELEVESSSDAIDAARCSNRNALRILNDKCDGRRSCTVRSSSRTFGNPCSEMSEYLEFDFCCRSISSITVCKRRARRTDISCPTGFSIRILNGFYGRRDDTTCRAGVIKKRNRKQCSSSNAMSEFQKVCNGRRTCSLANAKPSRPRKCLGTKKYTEVTFACIKN